MSHLDRLEEAERRAAASIISDVRDRMEKPLHMPEKTVGKHLQPNVTFKPISKNDDASGIRTTSGQKASVSFLCIPYFLLAPYSTGTPLPTSSSYPLRTLLQSRHMSTPKKRDMQQAVRDLNYSKENCVFHVAQVWCLMLGDSKSQRELRFNKAYITDENRNPNHL